jgi:3D (Asp-Asp-Asp) domain-containing protein
MKKIGWLAWSVLIILVSCRDKDEEFEWIPLKVTVSAYNSVPSQTVGHPQVTAWGDTLRPGMKCIAISQDLLDKGIEHNTMVKIEGLDGVYLVKDKMHYRWKNRIDLYMGSDVQKARQWGRKKLTITYALKKVELPAASQ